MKKKVFLGATLFIFFFLLIFFYLELNDNKLLVQNKKQLELIQKENNDIEEEKIQNSNVIEDVSYSAKDTKGNNYFLKASQGTIDQNESNYIFLKSVKAVINLKNSKLIEISSDFGKYNINNYDTIFSKNVIIKYLDNEITGDYLDFSWDKNLMIISRDVIIKNNDNSLQADVIEVNIQTRGIKIFMYEENKRINIKSFN